MTESDRRDVQLHGLLSNSRRHAIAHQFDEAIAEIERARAIDPIAPTMHTFAAMMYAFAGRHDVGFTAVRHALTLDPDHFPAHAVRGHLYDRTGEPDAALASYRSAHQLSGGIGALLGFQGWVLGRTGRDDDARQIVATLEQIARSRHVPPSAFALVFAGLGDRDAAFHHLDRACALRDVFLITLPNAHWWDPLRSDTRFQELLQRTRFLRNRLEPQRCRETRTTPSHGPRAVGTAWEPTP